MLSQANCPMGNDSFAPEMTENMTGSTKHDRIITTNGQGISIPLPEFPSSFSGPAAKPITLRIPDLHTHTRTQVHKIPNTSTSMKKTLTLR